MILELFKRSFLEPGDGPRFTRFTYEQLCEAEELVLAHGTSSTVLPAILAEGVLPRSSGVVGIVDKHLEEHELDQLDTDDASVYLINWYDPFYPRRAAKAHGGKGIVLIVRVPTSALAADENALPPIRLGQGTRLEQLFESLASFGACKHTGPITPDRIIAHYETEAS